MPGQFGVPGTDNTTGLRLDTNGAIFYVDPNAVGVSDARDGTDPTCPLQTVATALTKCRPYMNDTIVVAPNSNWIHAATAAPRTTAVREEVVITVPGIRIVGLFPSSSTGVPWYPVTVNGNIITVRAMDVLIEGFVFDDPSVLTGVTAILSEWTGKAAYTGDNLTVRHCYFGDSLAYGIRMAFTYYSHIHGNFFDGVDVAAIFNVGAPGDSDYGHIHDNLFLNNIAAIDLKDTNVCFIHDNYIYGDGTGTDNFIDMTGGAGNLVASNYLACTIAQYDVTCSDAGSGAWVNNHCMNGDATANPL